MKFKFGYGFLKDKNVWIFCGEFIERWELDIRSKIKNNLRLVYVVKFGLIV